MWSRQLIVAKTSKGGLDCLDTCQHLPEGQFSITTNAPALSLAETCRREVGRAKLVEIFALESSECLGFSWILEKGRIWSINVNLWDLAWRLCDWMTTGVSID